MENLSCENDFYLHDNKKSFAQESFCTWPRFITEEVISEVAQVYLKYLYSFRDDSLYNFHAFYRFLVLADTNC